MVVISGNITLMARAAQMVLTCNPSSGATPAGNANWNSGAATGALAANKFRLRGSGDVRRAGRHRSLACRDCCRGLDAARRLCALGVEHGNRDDDRGREYQQTAPAVG